MDREPHEILGVPRFAPWPEVRAAFRTLARRYHPDGSAPDSRQMAVVNAAYEALERRRRESNGGAAPGAAWSRAGSAPGGAPSAAGTSPGVPVGPGPTVAAAAPRVPSRPPAGSLLSRVQAARHVETPVIDFGQYAGWRISEIAEQDPRYLVWLSRHSSGIRFRRAIEQVLGSNYDLGRRAAVIT